MSSLGKKAIETFDAASLAAVRILLPALPRNLAWFAGCTFGAMALAVVPERKKRALRNLRKILPHLSRAKHRRIRRQCFLNSGGGLGEIFHLHRKKRSDLARMTNIEGLHHLRAALDKGKGVLIAGCHLANFPLGMIALSGAGFPVAVLVRQADNPAVEGMINEIRRNFGLDWIYVKPRQEAARKCLRWLGEGKILWVQVDQRNRNGIVVNFLGHPSQVAPGAALFTQRLGSPAIPVVTVRTKRGRYRVIIGEEIPITSTGDRDADSRANMEKFLGAVGPYILRYPEQWTWFHKMWKVRKETR